MSFLDKAKNLFVSTEPEEEYYDEEEIQFQPRKQSLKGAGDRGNVIDIHATTKLQVVVYNPKDFSEATTVADNLMDKRTVVINLESAEKDQSSKMLSFLSGIAYAIGGNLKKIAQNIYIITPYNVELMGDLIDELENNGMFFM